MQSRPFLVLDLTILSASVGSVSHPNLSNAGLERLYHNKPIGCLKNGISNEWPDYRQVKRTPKRRDCQMQACPECGSTSFKAKDLDERTVQISCAKCGWTPPPVKIDQEIADKDALR